MNETRIRKQSIHDAKLFQYVKDSFSHMNYRGERTRIVGDVLEMDILASY